MFEYIKRFYNVNPEIGLVIKFYGEEAIIAEDCGHYLGVVFDGETTVKRIHPTFNVVYTDEYRELPKKSRSKERYQAWLRSYSNLTFAEYIGCDKRTLELKRNFRK